MRQQRIERKKSSDNVNMDTSMLPDEPTPVPPRSISKTLLDVQRSAQQTILGHDTTGTNPSCCVSVCSPDASTAAWALLMALADGHARALLTVVYTFVALFHGKSILCSLNKNVYEGNGRLLLIDDDVLSAVVDEQAVRALMDAWWSSGNSATGNSGGLLSTTDLLTSSSAIGVRQKGGVFVGLKNASATCYMNSVLQQVRAHTHALIIRLSYS
jgi:hypothetical protein